MAKVFTEKFERYSDDRFASVRSPLWRIGVRGVPLRIFDIPRDAKDLWITLHDGPGEDGDRDKCVIRQCRGSLFPLLSCEEGGRFEDPWMDARLGKLLDRTLYLQVECR